jgi:hypothetical protein
MKRKYNRWLEGVWLLHVMLFLVSGKTGFAQSSTNYEIKKYVLDMTGTASQSTNYGLVDAAGQPSPLGEMFSTNYTLSPGFLGQAITIKFRGAKLYAGDGETEDIFGQSVTISGDYAAIGASQDDNDFGVDAGAVYLFARSEDDWIFQEKIMAADGAKNDIFGSTLHLDGEYLAVGAPWDDDLGTESGAAYVFKREGSHWIQQAKLVPSDGGSDNRFGISVAICGDYIIVGAFFDNDFGNRSGSAYIFHRNGTSWTEQAILKASDGAEGDWFGVGVSLDGDFAAVGSRYDDNENGTDAGAVYIFEREGTVWNQRQKLIASDGAEGDLFQTVEINGVHLIVGARQDDDLGSNSGSIYVFRHDGSAWVEQEKITASDGAPEENFGNHVAISGNRMVVGAYRDNDNGSNSGSIYSFAYDGTHWSEIEKILAYDGDAGDYYGLEADLNEYFIMVAARNDDDKGTNAGAVYVYGEMPTTVPFDISKAAEVTAFQILPAFPNPFNPETTIRYAIPRAVEVTIAIFNSLGQRVRSLENGFREPGFYSVRWDGRDESGNVLTSGIYICQIQAGEYRRSTKLAIVK